MKWATSEHFPDIQQFYLIQIIVIGLQLQML